MRLGLIGHGAIAQHVIAVLDMGGLPGGAPPAVLVRRARPATAGPREITGDAARFLAHRFDAVLECAGHQAVRDHGERVLEAGADLLVTSVGAFTDDTLLARIRGAAEQAGRRLIVPSAGGGAPPHLSGPPPGGAGPGRRPGRQDPPSPG